MKPDHSQRMYLPIDGTRGYSAQPDIYYECLVCGDVIPSLPHNNIYCRCRNIMIDVDAGRVAFADISHVRFFRVEEQR